jgi:error-prone DNA polymerase
LLAYASAYLKCHYLAAFTAAMLNNQPMGFYQPPSLVTDAQRHGLRVRPIDITCSDWLCTLEKIDEKFAVRLGLRYVKGLRTEIGAEIVRERLARAFTSVDDLKRRIPRIQKGELAVLAEVGALNRLGNQLRFHRRSALWQVERTARSSGPLYEYCDDAENVFAETELAETELEKSEAASSPLAPMTAEERLVADYRGTGMTVGPHPMAYHRAELQKMGVRCAGELARLPDGIQVLIAGGVIARQRPGTAKGFVFLSVEDETGIANAIINPQLFEECHVVVVHQQFLLIEGQLQNQDGVVSVKSRTIQPLTITSAPTSSHDFH